MKKIIIGLFILASASGYLMYKLFSNDEVAKQTVITDKLDIKKAEHSKNSKNNKELRLASNNVSEDEDKVVWSCDEFKNVEKQALQSQIERKSFLAEISNVNKKHGVHGIVLENIFQLAGGDLDELRVSNSWHGEDFYSELQPVTNKPIILDSETDNDFFQKYLLEDYDGIIQLIQNKRLNSDTIYNGQSLLTFMLSNRKNIESSVVKQFIDAGLQPNFTDISNATKNKFSRQIMETLLKGSTLDLTRVWYEGFKKYSLAMLAAEQTNYELFDFWQTLGSPLETTQNDYTVLDVLPSPKTEAEKEQLISIFEDAVAQGIVPYKLTTIDNIRSWLPEEYVIRYESYFINTNKDENQRLVDIGLSEDKLTQLEEYYDYVSGLDDYIKSYEKLSTTCGFDSKIVHTSIKDKTKTYYQIRYGPMKDLVNLLDSLEVDTRTDVLALSSALQQKDWKTYRKIAKELGYKSENYALNNIILNQLLGAAAPVGIVEEVIKDGASLNEESIFTLIRTNNFALTPELLKYGLNLNSQNSEKQSPIQYARALGRQDFIEFLESDSQN